MTDKRKRIGILTGSIEQLVRCEHSEQGLGVHQWPPEQLNNWTVTHIPSGYALAKMGEKKQHAIALLRELTSLTDWTRPAAELIDDLRPLRDKIERIVQKHGMVRSTGNPGVHSVLAEQDV